MTINLAAYIVIAILVVAILLSTIRILREYERGVVFTLGRFTGVKGPGLIILIPFVQQLVRVDLRTIVLDIPSQDVISRDDVSVKVNAVLYFRVVDADKSVIEVEDFMMATSQLAQTTLRSVLGKQSYGRFWVTGPDQAACLFDVAVAATPSLNLMPSTTFGN